jgi:hypothetical protein
VEQVKSAGGFMASKKHLDKKTIDVNTLKNYKLTDVSNLTMLLTTGGHHRHDSEKEIPVTDPEEYRS